MRAEEPRWEHRGTEARRRRASPGWLVGAVGTLAVVALLVGLGDLAISLVRHASPASRSSLSARSAVSSPPSSRAGRAGASTASKAPGTSPPVHHHHHPRRGLPHPGGSRHHHAPVAPPPPRSGIRLSTVTPGMGGAGAVVTVHGADLVSPNGVVVAHVAGMATRTDCVTRQSCRVTIPDLGGRRRSVSIVITTARGDSNPVAFRYTGG